MLKRYGLFKILHVFVLAITVHNFLYAESIVISGRPLESGAGVEITKNNLSPVKIEILARKPITKTQSVFRAVDHRP